MGMVFNMAGGPPLPLLTSPGAAGDLRAGKQLIDNNGDVLNGTLPAVEQAARAGKDVTMEEFSSMLSEGDLPAPDLLIRTGREKRISNFLLWQAAYSELYFTDVLFPDFSDQELDKAIEEYSHRERRFGKA